jgi:hypothetical protein
MIVNGMTRADSLGDYLKDRRAKHDPAGFGFSIDLVGREARLRCPASEATFGLTPSSADSEPRVPFSGFGRRTQ